MSANFMICVHDFPRGEVSVKVGIMELGLNAAILYLIDKKRGKNHGNTKVTETVIFFKCCFLPKCHRFTFL